MEPDQREYRWRRFPVSSAAIRVVLASSPAAAVVAFGLLVLRVIQRGHPHAGVLTWLLLVAGFSAGMVLAFEALTSRVRTLASLLDISMEFPYQPPSRFLVAMTSPFNVELTTELDGVRHQLRRQRRGEDELVASRLDRVESILTLAAITGTLEPGTRRHSRLVAELADRIGVEMGLTGERRRWLRWAALLHDVGKLTVPDDVLHKPSRLNSQERNVVRQHVSNGARIIAPLIPLLGPWSGAVGEHHERWDGGGYPLGLSGESISLAGRIVAVADTYATMTGGRVYRPGTSPAIALAELRVQAGGQFDPTVVAAFEASWRRRHSPRVLLGGPRAALGALAAVVTSVGWPAASTAGALGLVGAVVAVGVTAPGLVRVLPAPARVPLAGLEQGLGVIAAPALSSPPTSTPLARSTPAAAPRLALPRRLPSLLPSPSPPVLPPPTVDLRQPAAATEGVAWLIGGSVHSAGAPPRVQVNFGDDTATEVLTVQAGAFRSLHVFAEEGTHVVTVTAVGDGGSGSASTSIIVGEYQLDMYLPARATADGGNSVAADGQIIDPSADSATATVDYGDGSAVETLTLTARSFSLAHRYSSPGPYTVTVRATDDEGSRATSTMHVTVPQPAS